MFAVYVDDLAKSCIWSNSIYILLYADDILLIAPTVCELQKLLYICEHELSELDMSINIQKRVVYVSVPGTMLGVLLSPCHLALQSPG